MPPTYTSLLRQREFGSLFVTQVTTVLATSITGLYLGTIVNESTGSTLLTSFAIFAPSLANILGAASLMSLADSASPRRPLTILQLGVAVTVTAQALPLPLWTRLLLIVLGGLLTAVSAGLRLGAVVNVVGREDYATARSLMNLTNGAVQVCGYAFGAVLVGSVPATTTFVVLGVTLTLGAAVVFLGARDIVTATEAGQRSGSVAATHAVNRWAFGRRDVRIVLIAVWVPNGIIVGAESLFIPYAGTNAGYLLAAGAVGMLVGDLTVGRWLTRSTRERVNLTQRVLLAAPYLVFFMGLSWMPAAVLVFVASLGFSASLALQEKLVDLTPASRVGQIQGLESSGRVAAQGVFALAAGGVAEFAGAGWTITVFAVLSLTVTGLVTPSLRSLRRENGPGSKLPRRT